MARQTIKTYKGNEVRCEVYIKEDGSGDAPADWATSDGITVVGIATTAEVNGKTDISSINGLNQQEPYNTKAGNITYDWKLDQLFIKQKWKDDAVTPNEYHPGNMLKSGKKFAMRISGMDDVGENATTEEFTIVCTQCSVGDDSISVDGADGDVIINMSGNCAGRDVDILVA